MLVTRIFGDCPDCGGKKCFGNVLVRGNRVFRGCMSCEYSTFVLLPEIRKKIVYLDQFFFSGAFRGGDERFVRAAQQIRHLSSLQLLVAPFSSVHEDEAHQWRGYADLMKFIKNTSGGHKLAPDYEVERTQIDRAFKAFLAGSPPDFMLQERDAIHSNVHEWDDYYRIDARRYIGDIESIRDLKRKTIEELVDIFDDWQQSTNTFDQDVSLEIQAVEKEYIGSYIVFASRVASLDFHGAQTFNT